jgi:hypothetical protein
MAETKTYNDGRVKEIKPYDSLEGHTWEGAHWKEGEDFPFVTGYVKASHSDADMHAYGDDLVRIHTETIPRLLKNTYLIEEYIGDSTKYRIIAKTWTISGAKRVIERRVRELGDILAGELLVKRFNEGGVFHKPD